MDTCFGANDSLHIIGVDGVVHGAWRDVPWREEVKRVTHRPPPRAPSGVAP